MSKKNRPATPAADRAGDPGLGTLGALLAAQGLVGTGTSADPEPEPEAKEPEPATPARAVLRLERKGRGGKTVTLIQKLDLDPSALQAWARELRKGLGVGVKAEGDALVVQGDQRDRLQGWLEERGVTKIGR